MVLTLMASRLALDISDLDPAILALEYAFAAAHLAAVWPCIGDPTQLTYTDSLFFEGAAGLIVAARLFGPLTTGTAGIITKLTSADGDSVTYLPPPSASPEAWLKEAQVMLQSVSCVKASLAASSASFNFFRAGNDQRSRLPCGAGLYGAGLIGLLDYGVYPLQYGYGSVYYGG